MYMKLYDDKVWHCNKQLVYAASIGVLLASYNKCTYLLNLFRKGTTYKILKKMFARLMLCAIWCSVLLSLLQFSLQNYSAFILIGLTCWFHLD